MATLTITKVLDCNVYSVAPSVGSITTLEQSLIDDFCEPSVTLGGTIDVTTTATPLTMDTVAGFAVGDTITGDTSGASGEIHAIDTIGSILWVKAITGGPFGTEPVNSGAANITVVGTPLTTFEVDYGTAPQSTANFTVVEVIRLIPSSLNQTVFSFNGKLNSAAEQNAEDLCVQARVRITDAWQELTGKVNNFERVDTFPI